MSIDNNNHICTQQIKLKLNTTIISKWICTQHIKPNTAIICNRFVHNKYQQKDFYTTIISKKIYSQQLSADLYITVNSK